MVMVEVMAVLLDPPCIIKINLTTVGNVAWMCWLVNFQSESKKSFHFNLWVFLCSKVGGKCKNIELTYLLVLSLCKNNISIWRAKITRQRVHKLFTPISLTNTSYHEMWEVPSSIVANVYAPCDPIVALEFMDYTLECIRDDRLLLVKVLWQHKG